MDTNGSQDNGMGGTAHTQGDQHNNDSGHGNGGNWGHDDRSYSNSFNNPMAKPSDNPSGTITSNRGTVFNQNFGMENVGVDPETTGLHSYDASTGRDLGQVNSYNRGNVNTYNTYGHALDKDTINQNIYAQESSNLADEAWSKGDYSSWASHSLDALGHNLFSGLRTEASDFSTNPLDSFADLMRTPIGTAAAFATGPIGMMVYGATMLTDDVADVAQGEKTYEQGIAQSLRDAGPMVGGVLGTGLTAIGYGMDGDAARAGGTAFGGIANAMIPGSGGLVSKGVQGLIGSDLSGRAGAAIGAGLSQYGRGSNGHGSTSGIIQTDASHPAGIGDVAAQAQNNSYGQSQLAINHPQSVMANNLGALSGANTQPAQFGANNQALTQAQIDQQRTGVRAGGVNSGDTGIMLGGGSGATGIQTANRTVANEAASHGYAINNNPDLVDTSGYTYVNQNGILNV